jgi:hypothetical protein
MLLCLMREENECLKPMETCAVRGQQECWLDSNIARISDGNGDTDVMLVCFERNGSTTAISVLEKVHRMVQ